MNGTITLPRSVVEQALEALKIGHESARDCAETFHIEMAGYKQQRHEALDAEVKQISDAIGVLRAALEQPQGEQEPIGWVTGYYGGRCTVAPCNGATVLPVGMALYTHPQPKRQPLTEEEIAYCIFEARLGAEGAFKRNGSSSYRIARAIERAHKIGGKA